jgi:hypothetical protein
MLEAVLQDIRFGCECWSRNLSSRPLLGIAHRCISAGLLPFEHGGR